jgi:hypothetical protein
MVMGWCSPPSFYTFDEATSWCPLVDLWTWANVFPCHLGLLRLLSLVFVRLRLRRLISLSSGSWRRYEFLPLHTYSIIFTPIYPIWVISLWFCIWNWNRLWIWGFISNYRRCSTVTDTMSHEMWYGYDKSYKKKIKITNTTFTIQKLTSGLVGKTERSLATKAGHLEILAGGKKDRLQKEKKKAQEGGKKA